MKTFKTMAAQGDCLIRKIDKLPDNVELAKANGEHYTVAHSETGHNHVIDRNKAQLLIDKTNEFIAYLDVKEDTPIEHQRSYDTHESIMIPKGLYEVRRQREYTPEGYRKAQD